MKYDDQRELPSDRRRDREAARRADKPPGQEQPWRPERYPSDSRNLDRESTEHNPGAVAEEGNGYQPRHSFRGSGPVDYSRSDARILEDICERLTDDEYVDASAIHVDVKDGQVTLIGTVTDRQMKSAAEDCAASVSGVRDVQNQLRTLGQQPTPTKGS